MFFMMIENQINQKKGKYQKLENNCQFYVQQLFTKLTGQVSSLLSLKGVYDRSKMEFCSEWLRFTLFCLKKMNWTILKEEIIHRWNQWRHYELVHDNDEQTGEGQDGPGSGQVP